MRPLKCWAWKPVCAWAGHKPVPGIMRTYNGPMLCVMCEHCHKVLPS